MTLYRVVNSVQWLEVLKDNQWCRLVTGQENIRHQLVEEIKPRFIGTAEGSTFYVSEEP